MLAAALALVGLVGSVGGRGEAAPVQIPVRDFVPTQWSIGKASARLHLDEWKREAKKAKLSLKRYAKDVLEAKLAKRIIPAVLDPDGVPRNTDAHHRIFALRLLEKEAGVRLSLPVELMADYRGRSQEAFAADFVEQRGKGWFNPRYNKQDAVAKMASLPKSYAGLRDDPVRSSVDTAFEALGLSGKQFVDYVEFKIGERLVKDGLHARLRERGALSKHARSIPPDRVFSKKVVREVVKMLREPATKKLMIEHARGPEQVDEIEAALTK